MKEFATCSLCGHGYSYPAGLDAKAGMHCASCGALIRVKTGLPFGEAPSSFPGAEKPVPKTPALPPVKRKMAGSASRHAEQRRAVEEALPSAAVRKEGGGIPAVSYLAWLLSVASLVMAFTFPSYGNDATDPLYMLQWLPTLIFGCTAAILFIQGLAAATRH